MLYVSRATYLTEKQWERPCRPQRARVSQTKNVGLNSLRLTETIAAKHSGRSCTSVLQQMLENRSMVWFGNYRRVIVRWDRKIEIYRAFVHIACALETNSL